MDEFKWPADRMALSQEMFMDLANKLKSDCASATARTLSLIEMTPVEQGQMVALAACDMLFSVVAQGKDAKTRREIIPLVLKQVDRYLSEALDQKEKLEASHG